MQVENHKEEVPFSFYEEKFHSVDPAEVVARTGVKWDGKEFYVNLLGVEYAIAHPKYAIRKCHSEEAPSTPLRSAQDDITLQEQESADGSLPGANETKEKSVGAGLSAGTCPLPVQTFLLRYLMESKKVAWGGGWKTFREMPWGELYIKPYTGRVLTRAAFTFGTRVEKFRDACEKMGAMALSHGDAGYQFDLVDGFAMQIMVWEGDDEFPPNAQVIYSDNFAEGFGAEDRVVAGDILISAIKGNM